MTFKARRVSTKSYFAHIPKGEEEFYFVDNLYICNIMGDFRIIIDAVGSHGQDRDKKDGEKVDFTHGGNGYPGNALNPEAIAQTFVAALRGAGVNVTGAKVVHWPADNYPKTEGDPNGREAGAEVVDDLITGVRKNQF